MCAAYDPPTEIIVPFNPAFFTSNAESLTLAEANARFLQLTGGSLSGLTNFDSGLQTSIGSVTTPSLSFTSDPNTGIYSSTVDTLDFSTGGVDRLSLSSAGLKIGASGIAMTNVRHGLSVIAPALAPGASTTNVAAFGITYASVPRVLCSFNAKGGVNSQGLLLSILNITTSNFTYSIYNALGVASPSLNQEVDWLAWI